MAVKVSMTINIMEDGQVSVVGPLHDKVLCYGLLQVARDIVKDYKDNSNQIIPANFIPKVNPN